VSHSAKSECIGTVTTAPVFCVPKRRSPQASPVFGSRSSFTTLSQRRAATSLSLNPLVAPSRIAPRHSPSAWTTSLGGREAYTLVNTRFCSLRLGDCYIKRRTSNAGGLFLSWHQFTKILRAEARIGTVPTTGQMGDGCSAPRGRPTARLRGRFVSCGRRRRKRPAVMN
jgi:hypothetical protein